MVIIRLVYLVTLSLFHSCTGISQCWQKGRSVTQVDREILEADTIEHCDRAVRLIAAKDQSIKSVAFETNGNAKEGFCKMSTTKNSHEMDSAYFALLKCLDPILQGTWN